MPLCGIALGKKPGDPVIVSYKGGGWTGVVFIIAIIAVWFFCVLDPVDDEEIFKISLFCIICIFPCLYLSIGGFRFRIYVYPFKSYILYRNVFNKTYEIHFEDIIYVRFVSFYMKIKTKTKTCFFGCSGMHNSDVLLQALIKNRVTMEGKNKYIHKS